MTGDGDLPLFLAASPGVARITVERVEGSAPRDAGTWMLVAPEAEFETIGGGALEHRAIAAARAMLAEGGDGLDLTMPLGPEIGQCCGGRVTLSIRRLDEAARAALHADHAADIAARPAVHVFGVGHVGRALARALSLLPVRAVLVDSRADLLAAAPAAVETVLTPLPEAVVRAASPGAAFIVMTHDHATDFLIAREALARGDAAYVGLIGSRSKRAAFEGWLRREGDTVVAAPLVCPIGGHGTREKRPAAIASFVAAEVMARLGDAAAESAPVSAGAGRHAWA